MEVKTIAVIGAGAEGQAIARLALRAGYRTVLEDFSITTTENAAAAIRQSLGVESTIDAGERHREDLLANLSTSNRVEDAIRDAELIIETAADEMETKLELFTLFDKFAKPNAILATTSKLHAISEIAEITSCPERCVSLNFQRPPFLARIDLIPGSRTSLGTIATCQAVFMAISMAQDRPRGG